MFTKDFDYHLPAEQIAQKSVEPRDSSKLMLLDRETGETQHRVFRDIISELKSGDVLVMNNTKVFKARLFGAARNREFEVFLLRPRATESGSVWETLVRPAKHLQIGDPISLYGLTGEVLEKTDDGVVLMRFAESADEVIAFADANGEVPIPPYVDVSADATENYQTVYAEHKGSVAAPTAGFHFTDELIEQLKERGVQFEFVTLHVGLGTFRPVKTDTLEEHEMHAEFVSVSKEVAGRINAAKDEGRRVVAVGTTTVRTLEGIAEDGRLPEGYEGDVNLFIKPGFSFQIIDALITNFHLPKSTLLVLVSALAGREHVLAAYEEAVASGYRFFSFGDAMFIC